MKALVTGASGFIGSTLIEQLSTLGCEVFALMRKSSSAANLTTTRFKKVEGDLSDIQSLHEAVKGMDYVFHLAGATAAPSREAYFEANARGTERLARAVKEANPGIRRFIYISSLAAGGPTSGPDPKKETDPSQPVSFYGESKLQGEKEVLKFSADFPVAIVRPPMVYGPRDKGIFVIIQTVSRNLMPIIKGKSPDGQKYYSLIHSEDLCRGIIQVGLATVTSVPTGEIFYLTGDGVYSYKELLSLMAECLDKDPFTFKIPYFVVAGIAAGLSSLGAIIGKSFPLNLDKLNELAPDYWICSNNKAKEKLGFKPEYDLRKGLSHTINWYKQERWI